MEKNCRSGILELEKFPHGILVRGNTIAYFNVGIIAVNPGIGELTHEDPYLLAPLQEHTDNSFTQCAFAA